MYQYQIIITELELQILKLKVLLYNNGTLYWTGISIRTPS